MNNKYVVIKFYNGTKISEGIKVLGLFDDLIYAKKYAYINIYINEMDKMDKMDKMNENNKNVYEYTTIWIDENGCYKQGQCSNYQTYNCAYCSYDGTIVIAVYLVSIFNPHLKYLENIVIPNIPKNLTNQITQKSTSKYVIIQCKNGQPIDLNVDVITIFDDLTIAKKFAYKYIEVGMDEYDLFDIYQKTEKVYKYKRSKNTSNKCLVCTYSNRDMSLIIFVYETQILEQINDINKINISDKVKPEKLQQLLNDI